MSNLRGIIINQQLKQQQSPFVLSLTNVTCVVVYHLWKTACSRHARHHNPLFNTDPDSNPGSKSRKCSFSTKTVSEQCWAKSLTTEAKKKKKVRALGYHMEVRNLARTWPKKFLIHYGSYKVWTNYLKYISFKSLKEPGKMLICLSTLSGSGIADFVFKTFQQESRHFLNFRLLIPNYKWPEISPESWLR